MKASFTPVTVMVRGALQLVVVHRVVILAQQHEADETLRRGADQQSIDKRNVVGNKQGGAVGRNVFVTNNANKLLLRFVAVFNGHRDSLDRCDVIGLIGQVYLVAQSVGHIDTDRNHSDLK